MAKNDTFKNDVLKLIFHGIPISDIAANAGVPITSLVVALHTADPGGGGDQTTSELSYTGYVRQTKVRSSVGWTITGNSVSPATPILFPLMTAGAGGTVTHWSVGTGTSNKILYRGVVTPNLVVIVGKQPRIVVTSTITES